MRLFANPRLYGDCIICVEYNLTDVVSAMFYRYRHLSARYRYRHLSALRYRYRHLSARCRYKHLSARYWYRHLSARGD